MKPCATSQPSVETSNAPPSSTISAGAIPPTPLNSVCWYEPSKVATTPPSASAPLSSPAKTASITNTAPTTSASPSSPPCSFPPSASSTTLRKPSTCP